MKWTRLIVLLSWAGLSASAAVPRAPLPPIAPAIGALGVAPVLPAASNLGAPPVPFALTAPAPTALTATENGVILTGGVVEGLTALRRASHPLHPQVVEIVARINASRPELPMTAENLFLVRDAELLRRLEIPEDAAGAARILSDGRSEVPVVILVAARPVGLDDFVEFGVHEAIHLMDGGILRVRHDEELKHFFAEGWTQRRAIVMANEILSSLGRPAAAGKAYQKEIALTDAFSALHGSAPLDELVRTGSDEGMRRALGARWDLAGRLVSGDGGSKAERSRRLDALIALVRAETIGPDEERVLLDYVRR